MYRAHSVGVVVPAYNEEGFVGRVIETMPAFVDRVYVVDDRSTDGTWDEITRYAERATPQLVTDGNGSSSAVQASSDGGGRADRSDQPDRTAPDGGSSVASSTDAETDRLPETDLSSIERERELDRPIDDHAQRSEASLETSDRSGQRDDEASKDASTTVVPIRHERNRGVGGAIKTGYQRALEDGMDVTAVMAGDAQMDPDQLHRLLDPIVEGQAEYAKGNRLADRDHRESMSNWRLFGNVTLTVLTKVASGYWEMMDPQNGYTAISRGALEAVDLDALYEEYGFANDLLVELNTAGYRIADVSMPAVYGDERSHIEYRTFVPRLSKLLLTGFLRRLGRRYVVREFHPLVVLYGLGVAGWLLATAAFGWAAANRARAETRTGRIGWTVLYAFLGAMCLAFAMTLDHEANVGTVTVVTEE
ncbi:glycosyltransferase family 2 protein [Saliphagus sp. GCM10025317]